MPSSMVHANGLDLYIEDHDAHARVPLLCIGGLSMSTSYWQFQVPAWEAHYRTIVFDNRDVGRSTIVRTAYTVRDMARDALALADALRLDSFHLLGYSLGGAIAQELALSAPRRVRSLTLCVTFARTSRWVERRMSMWATRALTESLANRVEDLLLQSFTEEFYDGLLLPFVRARMLEPPTQPADAFARQLQAIASHRPALLAALATHPVHVIGGERDLLAPVWKSQQLHEAIPGSTLTVMARAPHALNVERATDYNSLVLDFLAAHP